MLLIYGIKYHFDELDDETYQKNNQKQRHLIG